LTDILKISDDKALRVSSQNEGPWLGVRTEVKYACSESKRKSSYRVLKYEIEAAGVKLI